MQREEWTSAEYADLHVDDPRQARPDGRLDHASSRTAAPPPRPSTVEITVNIPLVGGKIEKLIADMLRKALRAEEQVARDYLARLDGRRALVWTVAHGPAVSARSGRAQP